MDNDTRVGAECWYRWEEGRCKLSEWRRGWLRGWGQDSEELDTGVAVWPVGVVEDQETARVRSVYAGQISFAKDQPSE